MDRKIQALSAFVSVAITASALAAVSPEEAKQLGGSVLTEWGAERAGNKEGSIPAWTGERIKIPASYNPSEPGQVPDPFGDKPLYTITAQNAAQYADKLSVGQLELLKKYPNFRMNIYPTHRTVNFPKAVIENTLKNATACHTGKGGLSMEGCYAGVAFPIPKTGNEVVWNHLTAYSPAAFAGMTNSWIVDASGKPQLQGLQNVSYHFAFWDTDKPGPRASNTLYWMLRFDTEAPARLVGQKYVILSPLDPIDPGQRAWLYVPGQRRVKLAPDLAYDTPSPASGGASTMDEQQVFLGAQDRFDFKLKGKKERYLIVNDNRSADFKVCPPEVFLTKNFPNPDCVRFELHRAWEVEATLKPGFRNIMPKRVMYFDEDWSGAALGDQYDAASKLYRVDYSPVYLWYAPPNSDNPNFAQNSQFNLHSNSLTMDLQTGIWAASSLFGCKGCGYVPIKPKPDVFYSPEALAGEGIR